MSDSADPVADFARLRAAFHAALEAPPAERAALLAHLQQDDPTLAAELSTLLADAESETESVAQPAAAPPSIDGYTLEAPLGRGATGEVWRARQQLAGTSRTVALKLLHPGRSVLALHRFRREWRVLARLDHPGIARLLDAGIAGTRAWLALEYVDGRGYAEQLPTLPLARRVAVLAEVCAAVAHAHARLVLHRDLKPANLRFGVDGRIRLLDFGIARLLDEEDAALTLTGLPAGTRGYAAPEQWRGEPAGTAADVYALGRLLAEANAEATDPVLAAIAGKATAEVAAERYASVSALAEDLADWQAGRPPRSGVGSWALRWRAWLRHRRGPLLAAGALLLSLGAGVGSTWHQAAEARREAERARLHLDALLGVIAAASPTDYAGRDPPASAVLIEASRRLRAVPAADPALVWQSQIAIGAGLVNLGRAAEAAPALEAALEALADWPHPQQAARELDALRLLAYSAEADATRLAAVHARVLAAVTAGGAPPGEALSALATVAGLHARRGDFAAARQLYAVAQPRPGQAGVRPDQAENYWRQRGWSALRERDLMEAARHLARASVVIQAHPGDFSALRSPELGWLRAELSLQAGDPAKARAELDAIRDVYEAAYPPEHPERGVYARLQARAAWLAGDLDRAAAWLEHAAAVPESARSAIDQRQQLALEAAVAAGQGDCDAAQAGVAKMPPAEPPDLPHHAAVLAGALAAVARCGR